MLMTSGLRSLVSESFIKHGSSKVSFYVSRFIDIFTVSSSVTTSRGYEIKFI